MIEHVRDVMTCDPATLSANALLTEACRLMYDRDIGSVCVLSDDGILCGIVTDRDIVVRAIAKDKDPSRTTLGDICSRDLITLSPDDELDDAVAIMRENGVRRLPVETDGGRPLGVVSLGDLATNRDPKSVLGEISARPANH
jgi:CBS domain-containing protein